MQQKNDARKDGLDRTTMVTVPLHDPTILRCTHRLLRLHSKESRVSAKSRATVEALKARTLCAMSFWRFAVHILDKEEDNISPTFTADDAGALCTAVNQELSSDQSGSWSLHLLQLPSTQTLLHRYSNELSLVPPPVPRTGYLYHPKTVPMTFSGPG